MTVTDVHQFRDSDYVYVAST